MQTSPTDCSDTAGRPTSELGIDISFGGTAHQRVLYNANVLHLELNADGNGVSRLVAATAPGRTFVVEAQIFILAGGGLETTRLLLASRLHSGKPMGAGDELIGRYYINPSTDSSDPYDSRDLIHSRPIRTIGRATASTADG